MLLSSFWAQLIWNNYLYISEFSQRVANWQLYAKKKLFWLTKITILTPKLPISTEKWLIETFWKNSVMAGQEFKIAIWYNM